MNEKKTKEIVQEILETKGHKSVVFPSVPGLIILAKDKDSMGHVMSLFQAALDNETDERLPGMLLRVTSDHLGNSMHAVDVHAMSLDEVIFELVNAYMTLSKQFLDDHDPNCRECPAYIFHQEVRKHITATQNYFQLNL